MILLYDVNETEFITNGIGSLSESTSCIVTENRNGEYDLKLTYPVDGVLFSELQNNRIIFCKPNPFEDPQPFRIYRISTPFKQEVAVYANHISYDLSGVPVSPFTASTAAEAMTKIQANAAISNNFTFLTDKVTTANMTVEVPSSARSLLGGQTGSLLDVYGGEFKFDRFTVNLLNKRGQNNGVSLRYGKNITDIKQELNISSVYTGIYPYWKNQDEYLELPQKIVYASGTFPKQKIQTVDLSSKFEKQPTEAQLLEAAQEYIESNNIGVPQVNITVSFVALEQTEEYKDMALLEKVMLCDDVNVEFPSLGISTTAECVTTEYDAILDRYDSITLGEATSSIADTISSNTTEIQNKPSYSFLDQAVQNATNWITNGAGYMVAVKDNSGNWIELCSLDSPDLESAVNVWRWNNGGFGHSSNGYNGPYETAITQDGKIVANFITSGTLNANIIRAGILASADAKSYWNLESGELVLSGIFKSYSGDKLAATLQNNQLMFYDYYDTGKKQVGSISVSSSGSIIINSGINDPNSGGFSLIVGTKTPISISLDYGFQLTDAELHGNTELSNYSKLIIMPQATIVDQNQNDIFDVGTGTYAHFYKSIIFSGDLVVNGEKNRCVKTSKGLTTLSAYETAEPYFGDIGEAQTDQNGECNIIIDSLFLETVNTDYTYHVFLQKCGRGDIWVESKDKTSFLVKGDPNVKFSYEIKAKQKGYESKRLEVIQNGTTN